MGYAIDLTQIPIQKYMEILRNQNLLPGRKILLEELDAKFGRMACAGIGNLQDLKHNVSSPKKLSSFSKTTAISEDYLTILKRELGSLEQKPVPLSSFPGIQDQLLRPLSLHSIKTSKDFYSQCRKIENMEAMSAFTGISRNDLQELYCLCNLVRINGVGPAAARTFYESGYQNISTIAQADAGEMLDRISAVNVEKRYYNAKLGLKDMQFVIDYAVLILNTEDQ